MKFLKRFLLHSFFQLLLVLFIVFSFFICTSLLLGYTKDYRSISKNLTKADSTFFDNRISVKGNHVTFSKDIKKLANKQKGWFIVLSRSGTIIGTYHAPRQRSWHISKSKLADMLMPVGPSAIKYHSWKLENGSVLLFGQKNWTNILLQKVEAETVWKKQQLRLSDPTRKQLGKNGAWVQLINANGNVTAAYGTTNKKRYSYHDLLALRKKQNGDTAVYLDNQTNQALIIGIKQPHALNEWVDSSTKKVRNSIFMVIALLFLLLVWVVFSFAYRFGSPIFAIVKWIEQLSKRLYEPPHDLHGESLFWNKDGRLKGKYRLYKDLIDSLLQLTNMLKQNQLQNRLMSQTREEWISGISHDLKTPLTSISGYAQMLESDAYSWTEKETRAFARTITEKSSYMMTLIEDLTLTYRLKNNALPMAKEKVDITEAVRRTVIHFVNEYDRMHFVFHAPKEAIWTAVDPKWFQRILDNVIANAVKYNPADTTVTVSINAIEHHLLTIRIEDDGNGMDSQTLAQLFNRYYRGTNTSDAGNGTGLGMAITKQLVELHGGSINVKSEPGKGTAVRILLPILP